MGKLRGARFDMIGEACGIVWQDENMQAQNM